jgi:hypothetical protein
VNALRGKTQSRSRIDAANQRVLVAAVHSKLFERLRAREIINARAECRTYYTPRDTKPPDGMRWNVS